MTKANHKFIEEIKRHAGFTERDEALLREFCAHAQPHFADIAQAFYQHVLEHRDGSALFRDGARVDRLHDSFVAWLERILTGPWDAAYCEAGLDVGKAYLRVGLEQRYMFTAMSLLRVSLGELALRTMGERGRETWWGVARILDIELAIMNESYTQALLEREVADEDAYRFAIAARGERTANANQDAAARTLQRYVHAVEHAGAIIIGLDTSHKIRLFNRRAEEVTGVRFADVEGHSFVDTVLAPSDRSAFDKLWREVLAEADGVTIPARCHVLARNGRVRELAGHASRAGSAQDGDVVFVGRDITDEELTAARVRQTERLAAVGMLAAGLAHEIRNPLNGALLHLTFLKRALHDEDEVLMEAVDIVAAEISRLSGLVNEFLDFARPSSLNLQVTCVQSLCRRAADLVEVPSNKNLTLELPANQLLAEVDAEKLKQVLLNLLGNASDAARSTIRARAYDESRSVVVEVVDDGPGLDSADEPIFDAFYSTKPNGTGLGLAIVHRIVSDHAGTIVYERSDDETIFRVSLPSTSPHSRRPPPRR